MNNFNTRIHIVQNATLSSVNNQKDFYFYTFSSYTNGFNSQILSDFRPDIDPLPEMMELDTDELGNHIIQIHYSAPPPYVNIRSDFFASSTSSFSLTTSHSTLPLSDRLNNLFGIYMQETDLCQFDDQDIVSLANNLSGSYSSELLTILNIMNWIKENINYTPSSVVSDAHSVYQNREGNRNGIINLILSICRLSGIPCRCVTGLSLGRTYTIDININHWNRNILGELSVIYPKSVYTWIEIFFSDRDWVPFDPFSFLFIIPPNLLRKCHSLEANKSHGYLYYSNENAAVSLSGSHYVDSGREDNEISLTNQIGGRNSIWISPPLQDDQFASIIEILDMDYTRIPSAINEPYRNIGPSLSRTSILLSNEPESVELNDDAEFMAIEVSPSKHYFQGFETEASLNIKRIDIPLLHFNNEPSGNLWLVLYNDNGGIPGEVLANSTFVSVSNVPTESEFRWCGFNFEEDNGLVLPPGKYWISLRYDSEDIVLWNGIFGNSFQKLWDTFFIPAGYFEYNNLVYLDLCFKIYGSRLQSR